MFVVNVVRHVLELDMKKSNYILNIAFLFATAFLVMSALIAAEHENLIKNGNFDKGEKTPDNWEKANGLTSFYINEEGRGRIVKMDSKVDRKQALDWMKKFKEDPDAVPPKPEYPKNDLGSIGSQEGVMLDSDLIDVKPGQNYKLTVDYKGPSAPIVFIKGFMMHPLRKELSDRYQTRLVPENPDKDNWKTYSIGFNPTAKLQDVIKMKVRIYAYWPAGTYYFDNIKVEEITAEEMEELLKQRSVVPEKAPKKKD